MLRRAVLWGNRPNSKRSRNSISKFVILGLSEDVFLKAGGKNIFCVNFLAGFILLNIETYVWVCIGTLASPFEHRGDFLKQTQILSSYD